MFRPLYDDPDLFAKVYVDPEAGTIGWPTGADLAPEVRHEGVNCGGTAR